MYEKTVCILLKNWDNLYLEPIRRQNIQLFLGIIKIVFRKPIDVLKDWLKMAKISLKT